MSASFLALAFLHNTLLPSLYPNTPLIHRIQPRKRINRIPLRIIQLPPLPPSPPIIQRQTPLLRNIQSILPPPTPEPNLPLPLRPLDPKPDVDPPMHLVDLPLYPRVLGGEVDFVAEDVAHGGVGAEGVERGGYDGGLGFLVVEEDEGGDGHGYYEDGEGAEDGGVN